MTDKILTNADQLALFQRVGYRPHEPQRRFHHARARFKVLIAGSRFGKSLAASKEVLHWLLVPKSRGWIVGPSYRLAEKEFRYLADDAEKLFTEPDQMPKIRRGGAHGPSSIVTVDGAEVHTLSAAEPANLMGEELDWLILAEGAWLAEEVWTRALRARLTTRMGVMVLPTTPAGFNWVHGLYLRGLNPEYPDWKSFQFATAENEFVNRDEITEAKRTLPDHIFAEQYLGQFVRPSGLVFPEFDLDLHVCDTSKLPGIENARTIGGVDFGYSAPFVLLIGALTATGQLVIRREIRRTKCTLTELIPIIRDAGADKLEQIWCDPSGSGYLGDLAKHGFQARPAPNQVDYGIERIRRRLRGDRNGVLGLLIDHSCTGLIQEFSEYSWSRGANVPDRVVTTDDREPRPEKANDHSIDALRYICLSIREDDAPTWRRLR